MYSKGLLKKRALICACGILATDMAVALAVGLILACASAMPAWAVVLISTAAGAFCACAVGYPWLSRLVSDTVRPLNALRNAR